jgi:outer membrane protein assembly factor BamB
MRGPRRFDAARALTHPLWWGALLVLVANDHVLKGSGVLHPAVTGKLSDVAGMMVAPVVLCALLGLRSRFAWVLAHVAVGAVFSAVNLLPEAARAWSDLFASVGVPFRVWADPTDLLALPALAVAYATFTNARAAAPRASWLPRLATLLGAVACLASSPWPVARPTVAQDRVLVEHHDGVVFVLDARSGSLVRSLRATGTNEASPAIHDRILYQVQSDGRVTGIHVDNPQTPFTIWKHPDPETWVRILHVDAHRLFVAAGDNHLYAVDRVFGTVGWSLPIDTTLLEELTFVEDSLLASDQDRVRAVNVRTGQTVWEYRAQDRVGAGEVHGNRVYVASLDGVVHGLDLGSGREVWRYEGGDPACYRYGPRVFVQAGQVFACFDGETRAIAIDTRKVRWTQESQPVAVAPGVLLLQHDDDTLQGVDVASGRVLWSRSFEDDLGSRPTVSEAMAFVRDTTGKMHALDTQTGAVRWDFDWPGEGTVVVTSK